MSKESTNMFWEVEVKIVLKGQEYAGLYKIETIKRYEAIREALDKIVKENDLKDELGLQFRPYQLLGPYRQLCEVRTKCSEDGRLAVR